MFSSLVRQMQGSPRRRAHDAFDGRSPSYEPSPSPGRASLSHSQARHATADFTEADDDDDDDDGDDDVSNDGHGIDTYQTEPADEDGPSRLPILPLFSASYLGKARS